MSNFSIFLSAEVADEAKPILVTVIVCLFVFLVLADLGLMIFSKAWEYINEFFYEPVDSFDSNSSFNGSEQSIIEVQAESTVKFEDIAGNQEAKEELQEVVKFLKDPQSFSKLGASIPKGVLLGGPPGTGKTLFAKAIAGEAGTPFLKVSGSQFVELLVGIGASRVRELFQKARSLKPCIIFIDEIDSIARTRSSNNNMGGGNDEREQTLNQILTEMDGFSVDTGIVVIAATNRIDILDPAIKRPGRFDRQITIANPSLADRQAILAVHARGKKLDIGVSLALIAQRTIGFSGADLANLLNEAAILATRKKKSIITMEEINTSIDRMVLGLEKTQKTRSKVRQVTAFHEIGKAFLGTILNETDVIERVSIIPRNNAQSTTWIIPGPNQYTTRSTFIAKILVAISGRASEEIINGSSECTTRAQQDIDQITRNLRTMIIRYAMTRLQEIKQQNQRKNLYLLGSDVKQEVNNIADNYMTNFMILSYQEVKAFLQIVRPAEERLVDELLAYEELSGFYLRNLMVQYISQVKTFDILETNRQSVLYEMIKSQLKKISEDFNQDLETAKKDMNLDSFSSKEL